ncbi:pilus assembly protein [Mesorhizobium sp. M0184]|uniref:TadE/TadG family type IV pilus assembly protein n=1 Tax=Mesorhizobium sp. M0184 TaxID=2956906 RepID=UPI003338D2EA
MRRLKDLPPEKRGNFAVAMALMVVPLGLALGLSIDFTNAASWRSKLQEIADSAALVAVESDGGNEAAVQAAKNWALANGSFVTGAVVGVSITTPSAGTREAAVEISAGMPTAFMSLAGIRSINLHAAATARKAAPDYCFYVLDPASNGALTVMGSGGLSVPNCGIQVNSSSPRALRHVGTGKIVARKISIVGNYQGGGYTIIPKTNQPELADPLVDLPQPVPPNGCDYSDQMLTDVTIPAGRVFCGNIDLDGNVVLSPGVHYFQNATVSIGSHVNLSGHEVTIFVDSESSIIQSAGKGGVRISAPTSGIYAGIAIFGSRTVTPSVPTVSLSGNKNYLIEGAIYLPHHRFRMRGTTDLKSTANSGWIVAWQFFYSGNSSVALDWYGATPPKGLGDLGIVLLR